MKRKKLFYRICFLLSFLLLFPSLAACRQEPNGEVSATNEGKLQETFAFTLDGQAFEATYCNCDPTEGEIVLYTRTYTRDGVPSLTLGADHEGRTAVTVGAEDSAYSILAVEQKNAKDVVIPYNGFVLSIPTDRLADLRVRVGREVEVKDSALLGEAERMDAGYFLPDSDQKRALQRRVLYRDPAMGFEQDGIYFLTAEYAAGNISFPSECVAVALQAVTGTSYRISSVERTAAPVQGSDQLIFVGAYEKAYAETFLQKEQKMTFYDLDLVSSYSDREAIVLNGTVYRFDEASYNNTRITAGGVYLYDISYSSVATPESDVERVDLVVIDGTVAYIGDKNARNMLPLSGGIVVTFAGEMLAAIENLKVGDPVQTVYVDSSMLPEQHVRINGIVYGIDKSNTVRAPEGVTALYTPVFGATTQTNQYGIEIAIADGKVTAVENGVGDIEIPENGYVLSIHKDSGLYAEAMKVRVGDDATVSLGERNYSVTALEVSAINSTRFENMLIVYRGSARTGSNAYGYEIQVDSNGKMIGASYLGNMEIPEGGYVLSGHGTAKEALVSAYRYGADVLLDLSAMRVVMITTPSTVISDAAVQLEQTVLKLEQAKENLLYLDYTALETEIAELESCISEAQSAFVTGDFELALGNVRMANEAWESLQYAMIESHPVENRAIWYRSTEKSDEEVRAVVEKIKALNINTVYLETWYNGRFIGYSDNELIAHSVYNGSYDAMEGFVRICHENGIEVHAWVQNFFIGTVEAQEQTNQALADHFAGRWLTDCKGKNTYYYSVSNTNFIFLNPYDTEVRTLLIDFYREIITKYEVDGLHLDYIRFPELNYGTDDFGYNDDIVSAWQKENSTTVDPATLTSGTLYQSWITFRQEIINSFVAEVYGMVCNTDPSVWLSAAVYPGIPTVKAQIFQDCENWVQNGYMDELFSMSYGEDNSYVSANAAMFAKLAGESCFYSTGISAFGETVPMNFALQMTEVTEQGADGVSIFSLANIDASNYQSPITEGAFRDASVQVNRLNGTVAAQLNFILEKGKAVYIPYAGLSEADYQSLCALLQPMIDEASAFDSDSATLSEQLQYCQTAKAELASAMKTVETYFTDSAVQKTVLSDFEDLISWLTKSENRISAKMEFGED